MEGMSQNHFPIREWGSYCRQPPQRRKVLYLKHCRNVSHGYIDGGISEASGIAILQVVTTQLNFPIADSTFMFHVFRGMCVL